MSSFGGSVSPLPRDFSVDPGPVTSRVSMGVALVVVAVLPAALVVGNLSSHRLGAEALPLVLAAALPFVVTIAYLVAITFLAVPRMRFHVGARRFEVRTIFGDRTWSTEGLRATRHVPHFERRLFGTSMAGYATGWFLLDGHKTRVYATSRREGVLLQNDESRIFITPSDVDGMLEALHHAGVTTDQGEARRHAGGTATQNESPSTDAVRWSRVLIGTVLLGAPVIFLVVWSLPRFRHTGSLSVRGAAFQPTECHVLNGEAGVELSDGRGTRLRLVLPEARGGVRFLATVNGTPRVTLRAAGTDGADLGACGTFELTGEGFHGSGKRAVRGRFFLSCVSGGDDASGELEFDGCF